jgi:NAD-dependent dihydropyrimidine dehydrogenase PreA subunit
MTIKYIDRDLCDGCGICVESCPTDVIRLNGDTKAVIAYPDDCQTCYLCEEDCPQEAIAVSPEIIPPPTPY